MTVTHVHTILGSELKTAAGVDTGKVADGPLDLPRLSIAFDQLLVTVQTQSWDNMADLLDLLEHEVKHAKLAAQREARYEADAHWIDLPND